MSSSTAEIHPPLRTHFLRRGGRFAVPVPDALMASLLALAAAVDFLPVALLGWIPPLFLEARAELFFAVIVEGSFLLMQGTLVDIATRLKKRPPIWLIPIIVAGVALVSANSLSLLQAAWQRDSFVFIPLLISLLERGSVLWNMPARSRLEKLAARALISNRITTALVLAAVVTISTMVFSWNATAPAFAAGAIYFAVAAYDDWRVRGRRFAERPRVLFGFDPIHMSHLDPL